MVRPAQLGNYLHHQLAGAVWAELVFSFQVSGARYASNQSAAATATCSNVPASSKRCVAPRMRSSCLCKQRNLLKASRLSISTISSRSLHPVCKLNAEPTSYPSGHTLSGYLLAFALVEMVPEKSKEILARADDYAHNRIVCGVHYPSDVEASHRVAYAMFGYMMASPRFQRELAVARLETRQRLGLVGAAPVTMAQK